MTWDVPEVTSNGFLSIWPGVGSGDDVYDSLLQAGTEQQATGCDNGTCSSTKYYAWYEIFPQESEQIIDDLEIRPGDEIGSSVWYTPESQTAQFYILNYTTGYGLNLEESIEGNDEYSPGSGSQAEWVAERPTVAGSYYPPLPNFGSLRIYNAETTLGYSWYGNVYDYYFSDPAVTPEDIWMNGCSGSLMAYPGYIADSDSNFDVNWADGGITDPVDCEGS